MNSGLNPWWKDKEGLCSWALHSVTLKDGPCYVFVSKNAQYFVFGKVIMHNSAALIKGSIDMRRIIRTCKQIWILFRIWQGNNMKWQEGFWTEMASIS